MVKNYFLDNFIQEMGMNMQKIDISENDEQSLTDSEQSDESIYKQKSKVVL